MFDESEVTTMIVINAATRVTLILMVLFKINVINIIQYALINKRDVLSPETIIPKNTIKNTKENNLILKSFLKKIKIEIKIGVILAK